MARTKKPTEVIYGIEITKPHSTDMYAHNDMVADEMKANILNKWNALIYGIDPETDWEDFADNESTVELQKLVCYSGYGSGYTLGMVDEEFRNELENMSNYAIHQEYSYGCFSGLLPRTSFMMVGHGWSKHDYHTKGAESNLSPHAPVPCSKEMDIEMATESENFEFLTGEALINH